jgi:RNA polymerase sigma-70 factor (ECF subfamily)
VEADPVPALLDGVVRRSAGRLVARLVGALGSRHLELAEEAVQDALVAALRRWPWAGVPDEPEAWLARVAKNRALDRLRRRTRWEAEVDARALAARVAALSVGTLPGVPGGHPGPAPTPAAGAHLGPLRDDELALLFLCNHPALPTDGAVALTLRTVGGLSTREIARAFRVREATMAQRLVRAKRTFRALDEPAALPEGSDALAARRGRVLKTLYLMFSEGYATTEGEDRVRAELCHEAVRLCELVARHPATTGPEVDAHLALFLLQASRLGARMSPAGEPLPLDAQDRGRWNAALIARGLRHLDRSRGERLTPVHLEAGIAAEHAAAASFEATAWERIVALYDRLLRLAPSPVVRLNRAVAVGMRDGPAAGLAALDGPDDGAEVRAARAFLLERAGRRAAARRAWRAAAEVEPSPAAARYYLRRARVG